MKYPFTEILIKFLKEQKKGYEKRGYIPTIELLIEDLEKPEEKADEEDLGNNANGAMVESDVDND